MAGKPGLQVKGVVETRRALRRMAADLDDPKVPAAAADAVRDRALTLVPRRSGDLAGTIRVEAIERGAQVVAGDDLVPYAGVIEYGWRERNIEAQPYLEDALDDRLDKVVDIYGDHVDALVVRVGRTS